MHPILIGGMVVGALDILAAIALYGVAAGVAPSRVLQGVAAGLLGRDAFRGGAATAALGLLLHFFIALVVTAVYYFASRRWRTLVRYPIACGLAYGVLVYFVMSQIVVPLSRAAGRTPAWPWVLSLIVIHMVCVGLPAALTISRADRARGGGLAR